MRKFLISLFLVSIAAQADLNADRAEADAYLADQNYNKAFKAYRSLARDGDHYSQHQLAGMYLAGQGVRADAFDSYAWSVLAAESGLDNSIAYSEALLADIEDKTRAEREAGKLLDKYGKAALQAKADQIAARENGRRSGSCTGSRLTCRGVAAYSKTHESAGAPPVDPAGG